MPQPTPPTRRGLLADARHVVLPDGIVSTGWPAVEATCRQIGLHFDPWQAELNRAILAKDADGLYAADTVVLSIPRQVGKTWDVGALSFADSIIHPETTTVWTAHRFKVARETFDELKTVATSRPMVPHVDPDDITTAAGNECIRFRNGSRIVFAARERGAIRGFTKVRRLILDEAQILTERALSDLAPTQNQAVNPQAVLMGTPPKLEDPSEVFERLRTAALSGESEGLLYVECSADLGADPADRAQWRKANLSYPHRTSDRAMRRLLRLLGEDGFLREGLGIWDDSTGALVFGSGAWEACQVSERPDVPVGGLALAVNVDLTHTAIGAAAEHDGVMHLRPLHHGPGTAWAVASAKDYQATHDVAVVVDGRGPGAVLIPALEQAGVRLRVVTTAEVLDACADIYGRVRDRRAAHMAYPELDAAVQGAVKRKVGDRWAWGRRTSTADISPLEAITLATFAASTPTPEREPLVAWR